eukprot:NODE_39_length_29903_cov_0.529057.p10 type:complete len:259 gc:universal NODE_39_length_29903_cov_0.529057:3480-2704(-)
MGDKIMKHLNIPSGNLPIGNSYTGIPPAQTKMYNRYLNTPTIKPQQNILQGNINKNDFIQFLVRVSDQLIQSHTIKINQNFVFELFSRSKASLSLVQATLILYIRCKQNPVCPYHWLQEEKLFMGCTMSAHLFLMDSTYNLKSWTIITGLDGQLLKMIRHITLEVLDHRLWINRDVYYKFNCKLLELYKLQKVDISELINSISDEVLRFKKAISTKFYNDTTYREALLDNNDVLELMETTVSEERIRKKRKFMEIPNA